MTWMFKKLNEQMEVVKVKELSNVPSAQISVSVEPEEISLKEIERKEYLESILPKFFEIAKKHLGINQMPNVNYLPGRLDHTFGVFHPGKKSIDLVIINRHPVDTLRTLAHELVHWKQSLANVLHPKSGDAGSEHENEANYLAGVIMREFNHTHPDCLMYE
jgi:hypothetical protein